MGLTGEVRSKLIVAVEPARAFAAWVSTPPEPSREYGLEYMVHEAYQGDSGFVAQPEWAGQAHSLFIQGLQLRSRAESKPLGLRYKAWLEEVGETPWYSLPIATGLGPFCGTRGQHRRLEALWIELTGESADRLDVYYSARLQHTGLTGWSRNGQMCGTQGESRGMHSLRIFVSERTGE
jgi:hypothetical protein